MTVAARLLVVVLAACVPTSAVAGDAVRVSVWEGLPDAWDWSPPKGRPADSYDAPAMGFVQLPAKVNGRGIEVDRAAPFAVHAETTLQSAAGRKTLILRAKGAARLLIDGRVVAETLTIQPNGMVSGSVFKNPATSASSIGECIQKAVKKWKFAPSAAKEPTDVEVPMVLSIQ